MIRVIEHPIRGDFKVTYSIDENILLVNVDGFSEEFDFTDMPEGESVEIASEILPRNPVCSATKSGDEIVVNITRFYGFEEKHLFETGEQIDIPFGGGLIG